MNYASTILIVDDQLGGREVLRGLLTGQGYNLAFASSGEEALAKVQELPPDLILLDVMMPGMSGYDVCRRLRDDPLFSEIPVIMVTALDDQESRVEGLDAGADDFVSKPFNSVELRTRVRTITRLNRYRRLLSERTKFEWVVEQANDGYVVLDDDDHILYANPQAHKYLDLPADLGNDSSGAFLTTVQKQYRFEPEQGWTTWPETPPVQTPRYLVRPESPSAQAFWLQVNTQKLPPSSEGVWLVQLQDITLQVAFQRDIWEFQSLVSHKLRTPLSNVLSGLYYLNDEEVTSQLPPDLAELFGFVSEGVHQLEQDIQNILEYLSTSALAQAETGFTLAHLKGLVARLSSTLGIESVTWSSQNEWPSGQVVLPEPSIELILHEILENAKKFHPQQTPSVQIKAAIWNETNQFHLEISDNGQRLAPEQLAQVWTPYYQGEKYFTGNMSGMGLGLSRVALLVLNVGGTCHISNREETAGVIVKLTLPLLKKENKLTGK